MTERGGVIVLNGPPRSGKSSIAAASQDGPGGWMNLGVDLVRLATPAALQPGIGLRPGGERPDLEGFVLSSYLALYDSVAAHSARAINVVVDVGHHDSYSRPLRMLDKVAPMLAELRALFVGIRCPIDILMQRRDATGWSREGPFIDGTEIPLAVERWSSAVHDPGVYDIEIDTSRTTPSEAAAQIRSRIEGEEPTVFARLAAAAADRGR